MTLGSELEQPASEAVVRGEGRILVMDDNESVRNVMARMLGWLGYHCDVSANGEEVEAMYEDSLRGDPPYDAVILDLTLPGSEGGVQVLGRLRAIDPDVIALAVRGYSDDDVLANPNHYGFSGRLRKPMSAAALSRELARVLDGPSG